jgi:hypothetical protein
MHKDRVILKGINPNSSFEKSSKSTIVSPKIFRSLCPFAHSQCPLVALAKMQVKTPLISPFPKSSHLQNSPITQTVKEFHQYRKKEKRLRYNSLASLHIVLGAFELKVWLLVEPLGVLVPLVCLEVYTVGLGLKAVEHTDGNVQVCNFLSL